uniref:Uncharacterized protein n=1 Tax=Nelumbo nucifera TaxID=4432 RepID=A0A822XSM1_NELNU|nr:TPA_asm: hypothetical protein HUJ06_024863 [Nelumbo nucifera]
MASNSAFEFFDCFSLRGISLIIKLIEAWTFHSFDASKLGPLVRISWPLFLVYLYQMCGDFDMQRNHNYHGLWQYAKKRPNILDMLLHLTTVEITKLNRLK